jgi:hypothetical protein
MDLKGVIQARRTREARKKPFLPSRFSVVNSIVAAHGLDYEFLRLLARLDEAAFHKLAEYGKIKEKPHLDLEFFSLATEAEYLLSGAITEKLDSPYLDFARAPEELLLAAPLYRLNLALPGEVLASRHFAGLLMEELEKNRKQKTENRKPEE